MTLKLYNTLTNRVETFAALEPKAVTFYTCGPTVYDYAHIGNFRSFLNADLLRRMLELLGYNVRHVMNMTDVGHMTDDEVIDGGGEDKMAVAAQRLREAKKSGALPEDAVDLDPGDPSAVADYYIRAFLADARSLGLKVAFEAQDDPSLMPRPTAYIEQMIALTTTLLEKKHAYVAGDGVVYFDVRSFPAYGRLSGNTPDSIRAGAGGRVDGQHAAAKRHPADFLLWKPDPTHLMRWPSPWGEGYPGWHLECSVMAGSLLGDEIDIHSGGEDNIFPHHECEIAQTCGATGRDFFARYWFHTRHLIVEGQKMSKSKGNFFTLRDLLAKGASPAAIRLALTSTNYRDNANFTLRGLKDAQRQIDRWMRRRDELARSNDTRKKTGLEDDPARGVMECALESFREALCNDLNISGAIAALNEGISASSGTGAIFSRSQESENVGADIEALERMLDTLGVLDLETRSREPGDDFTAGIDEKLEARNAARREKDFATGDRIRDELHEMGIEIKDGPEGTTWKRIIH